METPLWRKMFTVTAIWNYKASKYKYLYATELTSTEKCFDFLLFRYKQVSLYMDPWILSYAVKKLYYEGLY